MFCVETEEPLGCLGYQVSNHWGGDSDVDSDFVAGPSRKKARLSGKRFAVVDAKDVDESKAPLSAKNTDKSTLWAVRAFMSWLQEYNERDGNDEKCPLDVMCLGDDALLCRWLCLFVTEARQSNGKSYTRDLCTRISALFFCHEGTHWFTTCSCVGNFCFSSFS